MEKISMNKVTSIFLIISVLVVFGGSILAQGQHEVEPQPRSFIEDLVVQLRERDWSEEDVQTISEQARELSWEGTDQADAELIAYALTFELRHGETEGELSELNRARLALELALMAMDMERLGIGQQHIATAAVEGVRNVLEQVQTWKDQGRDEHLGELIRETVRDKAQQGRASIRENVPDKRSKEQIRQAGKQHIAPGKPNNLMLPF